jgi:hypothetical protein
VAQLEGLIEFMKAILRSLTAGVAILAAGSVFAQRQPAAAGATHDRESDAARASHRQGWVTWAGKTGLSADRIATMWRRAMGEDAEERFGEGIETIDARSLRKRNQILFVTSAGNGHCLHLYIFRNSPKNSQPLWEEDRLPNGGGICHEQLMPYPTAYASPKGEIIVQVPTAAAWVKRDAPLNDYPISTALMIYAYRWNGTTYRLASSRKRGTSHSETFSEDQCPLDRPCD